MGNEFFRAIARLSRVLKSPPQARDVVGEEETTEAFRWWDILGKGDRDRQSVVVSRISRPLL